MDVYRTFSERQKRARRSLLSRRDVGRSPAGRIHAAEQQARTTLCGRPTRDLFEFGRSRYPFEGTQTEARCPTCDELAGLQTMSAFHGAQGQRGVGRHRAEVSTRAIATVVEVNNATVYPWPATSTPEAIPTAPPGTVAPGSAT